MEFFGFFAEHAHFFASGAIGFIAGIMAIVVYVWFFPDRDRLFWSMLAGVVVAGLAFTALVAPPAARAHMLAGELTGFVLGIFATIACITYWAWVSDKPKTSLPPPQATRWPENGERRAYRPHRSMPTQLGRDDARTSREPYRR